MSAGTVVLSVQAFFLAISAVAALWAVKVAAREAQASRHLEKQRVVERRLERVARALAHLEDLRGQMLQGSQPALVRYEPARAELDAAVRATNRALPNVAAAIASPPGAPVPNHALRRAREEVAAELAALLE